MEPQSAGRRLLFRDGWWIFDQISDKRWKLNLISDRILNLISDRILNLISDRILNLKTGRIPDIWQIIRPYTGVRSFTLSLTHSFIFFFLSMSLYLSISAFFSQYASFFLYIICVSLEKNTIYNFAWNHGTLFVSCPFSLVSILWKMDKTSWTHSTSSLVTSTRKSNRFPFRIINVVPPKI